MRFFLRNIVLCALVTLVPFGNEMFAQKNFTVVIDAGHGGKDPGAVGKISQEKNINLSIALKVGNKIKEQVPNATVFYTRSTDEFISLSERSKFANDKKADLFISIHTNSSTNYSAYGTETFTLGVAKTKENLDIAMAENSVILLEDNYQKTYQGFDPQSVDSYIMFEFMQDKHMEQSISLASKVQNEFKNNCKRYDRGVQQAGFWVLKTTAMPAVLVEVGFISNREEEKYLNSAEGQEKLSDGIFNAFCSFKKDFEKKSNIAINSDSNIGEQKETAETKPNTNNTLAKTNNAKVTTYRVQLLVSGQQYEEGNAKFCGLGDINYTIVNGLYKYTTGDTEDYEQAKEILAKAKKHFPDAFIVKFVNGKQK